MHPARFLEYFTRCCHSELKWTYAGLIYLHLLDLEYILPLFIRVKVVYKLIHMLIFESDPPLGL